MSQLLKYGHLIIVTVAGLTYVSAFYPGYLTADSIYMLNQGTGLEPLSSWHSPSLVLLWGLLAGIFKTSAAAWLVQIALYFWASVMVSRKIRNPWISLALLTSLLFFPSIFTNMAALWKDNWAQSATLFFTFYVLEAIEKKTTKSLAITFLSALAVLLIRPDYLLITAPALFLLVVYTHNHRPVSMLRKGFWPKLAAALLALVALSFIPSALPNVEKISPLSINFIWDIAGIKSQSGTPIAGYRCETSDALIFGPNPLYIIQTPSRVGGETVYASTSEIAMDWFGQAVSNPIGLAKHKLCVANAFFNATTQGVHYPYPGPLFIEDSYNNVNTRSELNIDLYWFFDENSSGPLWRLSYYLILSSIVTLSLLAKARRLEISTKILLLTLVGASARIIFLPATDFRYGLWIPIGSLILVGFALEFFLPKKSKEADVDLVSPSKAA